jgi:hypothetical protein
MNKEKESDRMKIVILIVMLKNALKLGHRTERVFIQ